MDVRDHSRLESIMESVQDVSVDTNETSIGTVEQYQVREERLSKSYSLRPINLVPLDSSIRRTSGILPKRHTIRIELK